MRIWRKLIRIEKILWWKEGLLALLLVNIINECNLSEDAAFGSCINGAAYQDWPIQRRLLHFPANRDALLEYRYGTARHHKNPAYGRGVSARFVFPGWDQEESPVLRWLHVPRPPGCFLRQGQSRLYIPSTGGMLYQDAFEKERYCPCLFMSQILTDRW